MMDTWMMVETSQLEAVADQITALRRENADLRGELEEATGATRFRRRETMAEYFDDAEDKVCVIQKRAARKRSRDWDEELRKQRLREYMGEIEHPIPRRAISASR